VFVDHTDELARRGVAELHRRLAGPPGRAGGRPEKLPTRPRSFPRDCDWLHRLPQLTDDQSADDERCEDRNGGDVADVADEFREVLQLQLQG
jgi:hypothetical protein